MRCIIVMVLVESLGNTRLLGRLIRFFVENRAVVYVGISECRIQLVRKKKGSRETGREKRKAWDVPKFLNHSWHRSLPHCVLFTIVKGMSDVKVHTTGETRESLMREEIIWILWKNLFEKARWNRLPSWQLCRPNHPHVTSLSLFFLRKEFLCILRMLLRV